MKSMEPNDSFNDALDSDFASSLRDGLSQLSRQAPGGPTTDQVLTALRRRRELRTRMTVISGSLAAALAVVIVLMYQTGNDESPTAIPPMANRTGASKTDENAAKVHVVKTQDDTTTLASQPATLLPTTAWGIAAIDSSIATADQNTAEVDGRSWNVSLSLTLASPTDTHDLLPVMELSSPRW